MDDKQMRISAPFQLVGAGRQSSALGTARTFLETQCGTGDAVFLTVGGTGCGSGGLFRGEAFVCDQSAAPAFALPANKRTGTLQKRAWIRALPQNPQNPPQPFSWATLPQRPTKPELGLPSHFPLGLGLTIPLPLRPSDLRRAGRGHYLSPVSVPLVKIFSDSVGVV